MKMIPHQDVYSDSLALSISQIDGSLIGRENFATDIINKQFIFIHYVVVILFALYRLQVITNT